MNTPLQHAAWAVIARWDSPAWKDMPHTGEYIDAMRKALADEQAQAVGPAFWLNEAGQLSATRGWAERNSPGSKLIPLYTHPAPPPAATGERAKVGNSNFESWYGETKIQQMGTKQRYREAYEAGLNEATYLAAIARAEGVQRDN